MTSQQFSSAVDVALRILLTHRRIEPASDQTLGGSR